MGSISYTRASWEAAQSSRSNPEIGRSVKKFNQENMLAYPYSFILPSIPLFIGALIHCFFDSLDQWFNDSWFIRSIDSSIHPFTQSLIHWNVDSLNHSFHCFICSLLHWFTESLLIQWLIYSLHHAFIDWFTDSFAHRLTKSFLHWFIGALFLRSIGSLNHWFSHWLTIWLIHWVTASLPPWPIKSHWFTGSLILLTRWVIDSLLHCFIHSLLHRL